VTGKKKNGPVYREKKQELKTRPERYIFSIQKFSFLVSNQYVLNIYKDFFFHKTDLPFIPAPTDKQTDSWNPLSEKLCSGSCPL